LFSWVTRHAHPDCVFCSVFGFFLFLFVFVFSVTAEEFLAARPGRIWVDLTAYGTLGGPWDKRRGFDSIVQAAAGFNSEEGSVRGLI
jgi:hypothetical protein